MAEGAFGNFRFMNKGKEKKDKASSLHHELQIDIMKSECKLFDQFLLIYSCASLVISVLALALESFPEWNAAVCIIISILIDAVGIFASIKNIYSLKEMNNMKIRKTLIYLLGYCIAQVFHAVLYFALNSADIVDDFHTNYGIGYTYVIGGMILVVFIIAAFGLYFLQQIKILADTIAAINGLTKNKEATYRSRVGVLDN